MSAASPSDICAGCWARCCPGRGCLEFAHADVLAWTHEIAAGELDAVVVNASGCGTTVMDHGFMFRDDPELAEPAHTASALARGATELN